MRLCKLLLAAAFLIGVSVTAVPSAAQDAKTDIRKIPCSDLEQAEDGDRVAAIFFFYGFHAALLNLYEVSPANLERNVRNVVAFCQQNPAMPIFEATPKAFQR